MPEAAQTLRDPTPTRLLRALSECAVDLADLRDPQMVLQALVRRTRTLLGTDLAYLSLNDLPRGETHIEITDGVRTEAYRTIRMPLGTGVLGAVAAGGTDVQTRDYLADPAMSHLAAIDEIVRAEGVRAIHGCPIRSGGRVVAALLVAHRTPIRFSRRQIAALRRLAEFAALALEPGHGGDDALLAFGDELVDRIPLGAGAVTELVAERLERRVEVHGVEPELSAAKPEVLRTAVATSLHSAAPVAVPVEDQIWTVLAIAHRDIQLATLVVPADPLSLGERGRLLLSRARPAVAAALLTQQRVAEAELRAGSDAVADLLSTDRINDDLLGRLTALGLGRRRPVTIAVVERSGRAPLTVAAATAAIRRVGGARTPLVTDRPGRITIVAQVGDPAGFAAAAHAQLRQQAGAADVRLGWAVADRGLDHVPAAHATARRTLAALRALEIRHAYAGASDLGPAGLLVAGADPDLVRDTIARRLQPLLDRDGEDGRLTETAWVVLECGGRLTAAASRLHVHPNTVRQRCERIATLLGPGWREAPDSLDVHFALRLWRIRAALGSG